jgi:hypothetical protein
MKKYKIVVILGGLALLFLIAGGAGAQGMGAQAGPKMGCQERFDVMDKNKDGKVTKEEFTAIPHHQGEAEQMFMTRDANGDGVVSKDEFCSGSGMGKGMGPGKKQ